MFCEHCGQEIPDVAQWCSACGTQVTVRTTATPSRGSAAGVAPAPELRDSGAVTALSVIGLVFGLIGMLGSFIPCLGSLAFFVGIPAAIASAIALAIAYAQKAKRTFAIVALTISLIGVVISGWQYFSIISAGEKARQQMQGR